MRLEIVPVTQAAGAGGGGPVAAAIAVAIARRLEGRGVLFASLAAERQPGPSLLATESSRALAARIRPLGAEYHGAAARGRLCALVLPPEPASLERLARMSAAGIGAAATVVYLPRALWLRALEHPGLDTRSAVLRADLPGDRALAALWVGETRSCGIRARVAPRALPRVPARRATAGLEPGGAEGRRLGRMAEGLLKAFLAGQRGQAMPVVLAAAVAFLLVAGVLAMWVGAATGKGRVQRAADLIAVSAARSMRDDFDRLFAPPHLPDGSPNPDHLDKATYLARAREAAHEAARNNAVGEARVAVSFPDADSFAPVRARARVSGEIEPRPPSQMRQPPTPSRRAAAVAQADAELVPGPASSPASSGLPAHAEGGGYTGPLAYRQGRPMRPDVARAFDSLAAAAARDGLQLAIASGYRSDAEQARLWERNPDPRWVARPGRSLHRCATELDIGPPGAYAWLLANAGRFGFLRRYSWEPWHFGFTRGAAPCAEGAGSGGGGGLGGNGAPAGQLSGGAAGAGESEPRGLPSFTPPRYRAAIEHAAARWNVPAGLLAAQLMAESGFNPFAVSPAGARGIAQFMPATAREYGLRDPHDPDAAIDAQAHHMADLLREFHSIPLALAAYNAGAGAVRRYGGIPPFAETRAYVARILGLLGGAGELVLPGGGLEVRLVA